MLNKEKGMKKNKEGAYSNVTRPHPSSGTLNKGIVPLFREIQVGMIIIHRDILYDLSIDLDMYFICTI